jgi:uncharacterized protein YodC (DUF2158 family)
MSQEFKVGVTVRKKSGGPIMTVSKLKERQDGLCAESEWIVDEKQEVACFAIDDLEKVTPPMAGDWLTMARRRGRR